MSSGSETPSNRWTSRITRSRGHSVSPVAARVGVLTTAPATSERAQEDDEVLFLVARQLRAQDQVEEFHRVVEGQQAPVVQVGRRIAPSRRTTPAHGAPPAWHASGRACRGRRAWAPAG